NVVFFGSMSRRAEYPLGTKFLGNRSVGCAGSTPRAPVGGAGVTGGCFGCSTGGAEALGPQEASATTSASSERDMRASYTPVFDPRVLPWPAGMFPTVSPKARPWIAGLTAGLAVGLIGLVLAVLRPSAPE